MDDWLKLKMLSDAHKKAANQGKANYLVESKKRLTMISKKKAQTAFIGAVSEFEKKFGFLWGYKHIVDGETLPYTSEQILMKNTLAELGMTESIFKVWWTETREHIFNNGMSQVRALEQEIGQYEVNWCRYQYNPEVK